jgi:hypothetical protein
MLWWRTHKHGVVKHYVNGSQKHKKFTIQSWSLT